MRCEYFDQMNRKNEVLNEKEMWQNCLSEHLRKSYNMVNVYMQNRQQPSIEVLYDRTKTLGVNAKDLLTDNDIKTNN